MDQAFADDEAAVVPQKLSLLPVDEYSPVIGFFAFPLSLLLAF